MVEILHKSISRRNFIKGGLATVGALAALGTSGCLSTYKCGREPTRWAFLADTHIPEDTSDSYRGFYPHQNLQKVVSTLLCDLPDGVVIAGDLARLEGRLNDYVNLRRLLRPLAEKVPVFMALGNHDDRRNFLHVFDELAGEKQPVADKHVVVLDRPSIRLIILDSLLYVNKAPGLLGKTQRQWLHEYLKECDDTATILCFHHTLGDGDGDLLDVARLFTIIRPIRKVKAIVYGHSHTYGFSEFEGIHLINVPATGYNFSDGEPVGWVEARLTARGGDFTLHAIGGNMRKDGTVRRLIWRS